MSLMGIKNAPVLALVLPSSCESPKSKEVAPFLKNLRKMLNVEPDEILRWTPDGRAFEIHDMEQMMEYVLPKYFKHRKYTSFQRQLNYFNFRKWTKSKAVVCTFSNDFFLRDQPELSWRITRKKSVHVHGFKPLGARKAAPVSGLDSTRRNYDAMAWKATADAASRAKSTAYQHHQRSQSSGVDMGVYSSALEPHRYYPPSHSMHPSGEHEIESLDWIDHFLPSLEVNPRGDDHAPSAMMLPVLRTNHYLFPTSMQASGDYACMATM